MKTVWKYSKCLLKTIGIFLLFVVLFGVAWALLAIAFIVLCFRICSDEMEEDET